MFLKTVKLFVPPKLLIVALPGLSDELQLTVLKSRKLATVKAVLFRTRALSR